MNKLSDLARAASFAAQRHAHQKRKGKDGQPYINHPLEVVSILANAGQIEDLDILIAAILHDTIEDVGVTAAEITEAFGKKVSDYVVELTDDKTLPKARRKQLQVEHAPHLSPGAKQIKLADKISNISEVADNPPDWPLERRKEYIEWGKNVVAGLRGVNAGLEALFDETAERASNTLEQ